MYSLQFHKKAFKDRDKLKQYPKLYKKAQTIIAELQKNPYNSKELKGDLSPQRSCRIDLKHRIVFLIDEPKKVVKILSMWGHYDDN